MIKHYKLTKIILIFNSGVRMSLLMKKSDGYFRHIKQYIVSIMISTYM